MPVMNGLEAARELKVLMPHVPLLMFTNNAAEVLEKETLSAGICSGSQVLLGLIETVGSPRYSLD
jgi:CheY-like chemotaxis protein